MSNYQKPLTETIDIETEGAVLELSFDGSHVGGEGGDPNGPDAE